MKSGLKVADVMTKSIITVTPETTALNCATKMKSEHIGSVIVADKGLLTGIITEQDFLYKIVAEKKDPSIIKVKDIMTPDVVTISPEQDITDAMLRMGTYGVRRLPVTFEGKIEGVLTVKDILKVQPELFDIFVDKIQLREEANKPIHKVGQKEGVCQLCGEYADVLYDKDGINICVKCQNQIL